MSGTVLRSVVELPELGRPTYGVEDDVLEAGELLRVESEEGVVSDSNLNDTSSMVFPYHNLAVASLRPILTQVAGWVCVEGTMYTPSPDRFVKFTSAAQVAVRLIEECDPFEGNIPHVLHGRTVLEGDYPAGVSDKIYWRHDVSDDHFAAVAVGGEELFDVVVGEGLSAHSSRQMTNLSVLYDGVTMTSSSAIGNFLAGQSKRNVPKDIFIGRYREDIEGLEWGGKLGAGKVAADKLETIFKKGLGELELVA